MSNENSGNVLPSEYCCHLFDFAKLAKIYKFRFANSWFDSPMATWRTLTGTLHNEVPDLVWCFPTWFYDVFRGNNGDSPMTQHMVVNAGWRRIKRQLPSPDGAGLNAKGLMHGMILNITNFMLIFVHDQLF